MNQLRTFHIDRIYFTEGSGGAQEVIRRIDPATRKEGVGTTALTPARNPRHEVPRVSKLRVLRAKSLYRNLGAGALATCLLRRCR